MFTWHYIYKSWILILITLSDRLLLCNRRRILTKRPLPSYWGGGGFGGGRGCYPSTRMVTLTSDLILIIIDFSAIAEPIWRNLTGSKYLTSSTKIVFVRAICLPSLLAKVPIRFTPLPLGGFRKVFKHLANLRLKSFASNILVVRSPMMYRFVCICQRGTGWAYDEVLITYKPYSTLIFDANDFSRKLAKCLKTCLNPPRGRGEKRIGTLASEDVCQQMANGTQVHDIGPLMPLVRL